MIYRLNLLVIEALKFHLKPVQTKNLMENLISLYSIWNSAPSIGIESSNIDVKHSQSWGLSFD